MCGAISTECEMDNCSNFTKEVYCASCKEVIEVYEANMNHLTGV